MGLSGFLSRYKPGLSRALKHTLLGVGVATALYGAVIDEQYPVALRAEHPKSKSAARDFIVLTETASGVVNEKEKGTSRLRPVNYDGHVAPDVSERSGGMPWPLATPEWYVDDSVAESGDGTSWETAFKTIQEGIDAAADGHRVVVAEGSYVENIRFNGKNISLTSTDPLDPETVASTIIDGNRSGSVVSFSGTEDETCTLSGFTVRNGTSEEGAGLFGGGRHSHSRAIIEGNVIEGNSATHNGGAVAFCDGIIQANRVTNNTATYDGGGLYQCGGGISGNVIADNSAKRGAGLAFCKAIIADNTISRNRDSAEGGGLYDCDRTIVRNVITECYAGAGGALADCDGPILNNTIARNRAYYGAGASDCDGLIQGNSITENVASSEAGGGLYDCDGRIEGNAISANRGTGLYECDGAIYSNLISGNRGKGGGGLSECEGFIVNNTIVNNWAAVGGGICYSQGIIVNCIIWGNDASYEYQKQVYDSTEPTYSCIQDWSGGEGNISEDPRFVDPDGPDDNPETYEDNNYRLRPDSPCIDAGFNDPDLPETDILGNPRILYGGRSFTVDMGAYEYVIARLTPGPGPEEATFTWSSLANKAYSVLCSEDLLNWRLADDTVLSQGNMTTSWIDDGSKTGAPLTLVRRRFYRAVMNP